MLQVGALKPVNQATPWMNSFVLVEGKDKQGNLELKICLDLTNLNKAIVQEPYHFKTPEDITHLLAEPGVITVCDCRKGYCLQQLDEASSFLTTFNTELGRFHYTVMPFAATVAGNVVSKKTWWMFWQAEASYYHHRWHHGCWVQARPQWSWPSVYSLLQTAQKCNVKLNFDKLWYKQNEVNFFRETYTTSGHNPARSKVSAITAMPSLTNKKQVHSFIGMINYLSKFSPILSELAEPIRELSKDKVPFNWGPEHQQAITEMKKEISSAPILAYYNPKKHTML